VRIEGDEFCLSLTGGEWSKVSSDEVSVVLGIFGFRECGEAVLGFDETGRLVLLSNRGDLLSGQ
jgi:hypothetical protein